MPYVRVDPTWRVADIVTAHPECARVLVDHGVDFCFRGDRTLVAACLDSAVDVELLLPSLRRAAARGGRAAVDPNAMSTPELLSFIMTRHHAYLFAACPHIEQLARDAIGDDPTDPVLAALQGHVGLLSRRLRSHLYEEEAVLFPALRAEEWTKIESGLVNVHEEHFEVGEMLSAVRRITGGYVVPDDARASYGRLMGAMRELELDTMRHIHVETYVLMRRVVDSRTHSGGEVPERRA